MTLESIACSLRCVAMAAAVALAGCAGAPAEKPLVAERVFYPPLPNPPRIEYLTTISNERDVGEVESGLAQFVLGADTTSQRLRQPYGVAAYQGKVVVADSKGPGLAVFDFLQHRFTLFTGSGNGRMVKPINVTIDADGTRYVTDTGRDQVMVYGSDGSFLSAFGTRGQFKPVDTAVAGEKLYVVDIAHQQVQVLDKHSGKALFNFGKAGSAIGELFHPTNIAVGPDGDVYITDTSNFRVQRFTAEGKPVRVYGKVGDEPGAFSRPKGVAIDRAGRLYVGDAAFENVQVFDNSGELLMFFGQPGDRAQGLSLPAAVKIDYENVELFRRYADPRFSIEYLVLVTSQFGPNKIDVFGFGKMSGMDYTQEAPKSPIPANSRPAG